MRSASSARAGGAEGSRRWWLPALVGAALVLVTGGAGAHEGHSGPHPTPTPKPTTTPGPAPVVFRIREGAGADVGWTGISHGQGWPAEQRLAFGLDCRGGKESCQAVGGTPGDLFGAPVPLSSGGVPACIVNRLRAPVGGSVLPQRGCGALDLSLGSTVFLGNDIGHPCPTCVGDPIPNDGRREGRCDTGPAANRPCDAAGVSTFFGATSNDCLPDAGKSVGELPIDLAPLTTGSAALRAGLRCRAGGPGGASCFCPEQMQANACVGGRCSDGRCAEGPIDGTCSLAPYRSCRPGSGRAECDAFISGTGECVASPRPCFGDAVVATGKCDPKNPTYVATFCATATNADALNTSAGLPGPARLVLPFERVR